MPIATEILEQLANGHSVFGFCLKKREPEGGFRPRYRLQFAETRRLRW